MSSMDGTGPSWCLSHPGKSTRWEALVQVVDMGKGNSETKFTVSNFYFKNRVGFHFTSDCQEPITFQLIHKTGLKAESPCHNPQVQVRVLSRIKRVSNSKEYQSVKLSQVDRCDV